MTLSPDIHIASLVVHALPVHAGQVSAAITLMPGAQVHGASETGKLVVTLEAESPLLGRGVIVARRPDPTSAMLTTYVFFARPVAARAVWTLVSPLHRGVARYLLGHVAATSARSDDLVGVR